MQDVSRQLQKLRPVQYHADAPQAGTTKQVGFIAQDVMQVFPNLVTVHHDTVPGAAVPDMHMLNYDGMAVYAIKLIQEQQQQIEVLIKRLEALKHSKRMQPLP